MLRFAYGARSHVGLVRTNNEDSGFAGPYLQLVADGVGGAAAGEIASATTAYVVSALAATHPDDEPADLLTRAVQEAHRQLEEGVAADRDRTGMATTLTAVLARGDRCVLLHIGDSRGYLLRGGGLTQLTTDHTLVQSLVDEGRLTREQVAGHPYRSVVLRWVDGRTRPEPDVVTLDLRVGDRLLVCSDGLSDLVPEDRIASLLAETDPDPAAAGLVDAALEAGGKDNVTCLVADLVDGPVVHSDGRLLGAMQDPSLVVYPAAVRSPHPA
jgi:serine/threonine protein phosphatase PrpC